MSKDNNFKSTKYILVTISILFVLIMLVLPLIVVIVYALKKGLNSYTNAVLDIYTIKALKLTLFTSIAAVLVNTIFGLFAAWCITKFTFRGKQVLTTLYNINSHFL